MKSLQYGTIFRETRTKIRNSIKDGTFALGKENKPKLVDIEDDKVFLFETEKGGKIRATDPQLSKESVAKSPKAAEVK